MTNSPDIYTAVTFAPVQGFIEKSRKLRDLYGSSYLLSFLAQAICIEAENHGCRVISPDSPDLIQGLPNQIIVAGDLPEQAARENLMNSWRWLVNGCQEWIQIQLEGSERFEWNREWNQWAEHTWEFFWVQGNPNESISQVRQRLNEAKRQRAWTAVNWQGESSTLSGADAVAWPGMGQVLSSNRNGNFVLVKGVDGKTPVERFYRDLSYKLGESFAEKAGLAVDEETIREYGCAFIDPDEELSIPEMVKRLVTHLAVIDYFQNRHAYVPAPPHLSELRKTIEQDFRVAVTSTLKNSVVDDLNTPSFSEMNRKTEQYWTGWFMGDGDGASDYLKWVGQTSSQEEATRTEQFSRGMRNWGKEFKQNHDQKVFSSGRVVYAGGDDFLGVLYHPGKQIPPRDCLQWLVDFKPKVWDGLVAWDGPHEKITASVGFVWASPQVPQRDVLQHTRLAESSAKSHGKDRVAIRVLFAGGNYLEWVCPWWILESGLFKKYRDRNEVVNALDKASWTHFYNDVAVLESRHAFGATMKESTEVAIALMRVYFPDWDDLMSEVNYWNVKNEYKVTKAGILGNRSNYEPDGSKNINLAINEWVINLAKVGFYLCSNS
jgi:CRISPR-associated protein Cmr2